jgi:hypothetical protein
MARTTKSILGIPGQDIANETPYIPLSSEFWTEVAKIFGKMPSADCRTKIDRETEFYIWNVDHSVPALLIAKACSKLVKAMDQFRQAYDLTLADPETGAHIKKMVTEDAARGYTTRPNWLDDQWWNQFEEVRERLLDEKQECADSPDNKPWDDWVRRLASLLRKEDFEVKTRNYESREDRRPPTPFVEFVTVLQATKLPPAYEEHEPKRAGHKYFAIDKALQRALRR